MKNKTPRSGDKTKNKTIIACLGPEGTFTHKAALIAAEPRNAVVQPITTEFLHIIVRTLFETNGDRADLAMLAAYNSVEGDVQKTFDLLFDYRLNIVGAHRLSVDLALGQIHGNTDHSEVYSHPKALQQSMDQLFKLYPKIRPISSASTAAAAQMVAETGKGMAIAHPDVIEKYGLEIVVEGNKEIGRGINQRIPGRIPTTDFFLVSKDGESSIPEEDKKYHTLLAVTPHYEEPWLLDRIFEMLKKSGLNKGKIHSRPALDIGSEISFDGVPPQTFYIEVLDHQRRPHVQECFKNISSSLKPDSNGNGVVRILGSYKEPVTEKV